MKYTYRWIEPSGKPPFKKRIRFTRGRFVGWTEPTGLANVRYAMFENRASRLYIPVYDLTPETKAAIGESPSQLDSLYPNLTQATKQEILNRPPSALHADDDLL
jgi:hypothetical protein